MNFGDVYDVRMPKSVHGFEFKKERRSRWVAGNLHAKKCTITYDEVVTFQNLLTAWNDFVRNKRRRADVNDYALRLGDNLFDLLAELKSDTYRHGPYQKYTMCDPKKRVIHKASVKDRIVHRLVYNALYTYFDSRFIADSYSCRVEKGTHAAQAQFKKFVARVSFNYTKPCYVLKFDIKKCFASIDGHILSNILEANIADKELLALISIIIDSHHSGLPLGNLTSQLFINIYLHELDWYFKHSIRQRSYFRYADDVMVLAADKAALELAALKAEDFLVNKLLLTSHKLYIYSSYSGVDILGRVYFASYSRLRSSTHKRALRRLLVSTLSF